MNTEKNKQIWVEKVHENLILRGRSDATFTNYKSFLIRFFNFYPKDTNIKKLKEEDIVEYLKKEIWIYVKFLDKFFRELYTVFKIIPISLLTTGTQG